MIVSQDANAQLLSRFDKFCQQFFDSLRLEMTIDKIQIAEALMFKPISKQDSLLIIWVEQREIKYLIVGNYNLDQYTTYNCPNVHSSSLIDSEYVKFLRIFESLFERAH